MSKHIKRLNLPKCWKLPRKEYVFAVKPRPGKHSLDGSVPLLVVVRDILKLARTAVEAKRIIAQGKILVDMVPEKDYKAPVGLMDTVSIPEANLYFRTMIDKKGRIVLSPIPPQDASWKLVKIVRKVLQRGGAMQVGTHDGRNLILAEDKFSTKDSLQIELPSQRILRHIPLKPGCMSFIVGGSHTGNMATVEGIEEVKSSKGNRVRFKEGFETLLDYVFVIGENEPLIMEYEEGMSP